MIDLTHYELCKATAERFLKESEIILYEYQNFATGEFPDVLCFNGAYSKLFEIKIDYQDFKRDSLKECRTEYKVKYFPFLHYDKKNKFVKSVGFEKSMWGDSAKLQISELIKQAPHLGRRRYYVCPKGLI